MQAIFQWQFTEYPAKTLEYQFLQDNDMKGVDVDYFKGILYGVIDNVKEIDAEMEPILDRPIADLNSVELAVMRIAIYELVHQKDVPYRVVINEALNVTKEFGTVEGFKYVNGVLDKLASPSAPGMHQL